MSCDVLDFYINKGREQGFAEGRSAYLNDQQRAVQYLEANDRKDEVGKLITEPGFLETILQQIDEEKKTGDYG